MLGCCGSVSRDRNGAAFGAALTREFEESHDFESVLGSHNQVGLAEQRVAQVGVEVSVIAIDRGNAATNEVPVFGEREHAPVFFGLAAPGHAGLDEIVAQITLLRIDGLLDECAERSMNGEVGASSGGENRGTQIGANTARIVESDVEGIVGDGALALDSNVRGYGFGRTEELQCVVDEMRADVEENAGARCRLFAPSAGPELRAVAVVVAFEADNATQSAGRNELLNGGKIAVEAAVLVDGDDPVLLFCETNKRDGFFERGGERLVDKNVASGSEALLRERVMRIVRSGNSDEANLANRKKLIERANDAHAGIFLGSLVTAALQDGGEVKTGYGADYGRMERASAKAKADESDINHLCPETALHPIANQLRGIARTHMTLSLGHAKTSLAPGYRLQVRTEM